ncbi:hypothetical protein J4408_02100 [Candidatus Pacearchaeota archaeon]|nr:hypothetical protein [Candidatus Pacearchaeota archaeon]
MDRIEIDKNVLDLKYKFGLEKARIALSLLTIGILAFLGTFIWYVQRIILGVAISIIIILISIIYYTRIKKDMNNILVDIKNLK